MVEVHPPVPPVSIIIIIICVDCRFQNRIYGRSFVLDHIFEIYVFSIGLAALVVCVAVVLFALGFSVTIIQLGVRILCRNIFNISVLGSSVENVCLTIPGLSSDPICGWQVLEVCGAVTNMRVRLVMIGSALWIWCHLIWLIVLVASLESHRKHKVVIQKKQEKTPMQ